MRLLEHEAKGILRGSGLEVPRGVLVRQPTELEQALSTISFPAMVKAQVPVGGRGRAGVVIRVETRELVGLAPERL